MSTDKPEAKVVGAHEFRFVAPDRVVFTFRGEFTGAEADDYLDFVFAHAPQGNEALYGIYDLTELTRVSEAARKRIVSVDRPYPYAGIAVIGASLSMRAVATMIMRAGRVISPERLGFPYKFVSSLDEVNAWFDELRRKAK